MDDDRPYVIESPTRIKLGPDAKHWAREWGWSDEQLARYLLQQDRLREAGITVEYDPQNAEGDVAPVHNSNVPGEPFSTPNYAGGASPQELATLFPMPNPSPSPAPNQLNNPQVQELANLLGVKPF
jgi:hypothetical protein